MPQSRELSIIIVNWNSFSYVCDCVRSVYESSGEVDFEILVVDNASPDGDAARLKAMCPEISVICSSRNLGFAGANNLGVQYASGRYLLFLNPDTKIIDSAIEAMLQLLKSSSNVGVVGCKLLNADGSVQISCIQPFPTIANQILDVDVLQRRWSRWKLWGNASCLSDGTGSAKVEAVSGACLMTDRNTFQQAGGFDERYFMYAEDVAFCYQVRNIGRDVYFTNAACVIHYGGGSSKQRKGNEWVAMMQREAILLFCRSTRGRLYAEMYRVAMGLSAVCRLFVIALAFPFVSEAKKRDLTQFSTTKWVAVLKWAFGLDRELGRAGEGA